MIWFGWEERCEEIHMVGTCAGTSRQGLESSHVHDGVLEFGIAKATWFHDKASRKQSKIHQNISIANQNTIDSLVLEFGSSGKSWRSNLSNRLSFWGTPCITWNNDKKTRLVGLYMGLYYCNYIGIIWISHEIRIPINQAVTIKVKHVFLESTQILGSAKVMIRIRHILRGVAQAVMFVNCECGHMWPNYTQLSCGKKSKTALGRRHIVGLRLF